MSRFVSMAIGLLVAAVAMGCGSEPPPLAEDSVRVDVWRVESAYDVAVTRGSQRLATWSVAVLDAELGARITRVLREPPPSVPTSGLVFCASDAVAYEAVAELPIDLPGAEHVRCAPDRSNCPDTCPSRPE